MTTIKTVAVVGGTGNLGPSAVKHIAEAGFDVTVLSRSSDRPISIPSAAHVVKVDYDSQDSLVAALRGNDAIVVTLGGPSLALQPALVEASIAAGVKFFIASEYGANNLHPHVATFPVFQNKVKTQKLLAEKAQEGKIDYTLLYTGAFLDWGLQRGLLVPVKGGAAAVFDGGDVPFSATTLDGIGKAMAGALKQPDQVRNRPVFVHNVLTTQNKLLAAAKKASPGAEFHVIDKSAAQVEKDTWEALKIPPPPADMFRVMIGFIQVSLFNPDYGGAFRNTENDLLGVPEFSSDEQVDDMVAAIANGTY